MAAKGTEAVHDLASGIDLREPAEIAAILAEAQVAASRTVLAATAEIAAAAAMVARALGSGGRLVYAAAGSSGLMALADALELPGTYGIDRDRVIVLIAGGAQALTDLAGGPEDDATEAARRVAEHAIGPDDCLIAVSASGSTPYAVGALEVARDRGAATIAIANNAGTPLLEKADCAVLVATPPEVIAGSTRMGAGTAQKIALNAISTLAAIRLGHVHDGYMVNLRADNAKLRDRAARIVAAIAGCAEEDARSAIDQAGGSVKAAVLIARGATDADTAERFLAGAGQHLRAAVAQLNEGSSSSRQNRA